MIKEILLNAIFCTQLSNKSVHTIFVVMQVNQWKCINMLLVLREKCQMNSFYRKICIEITIKRWNTLSVQYFVTSFAPEIIIVTIKAFGRTYGARNYSCNISLQFAKKLNAIVNLEWAPYVNEKCNLKH